MGKSRNRLYLEADSLLLNLTAKLDENLERTSGYSALEKSAAK